MAAVEEHRQVVWVFLLWRGRFAAAFDPLCDGGAAGALRRSGTRENQERTQARYSCNPNAFTRISERKESHEFVQIREIRVRHKIRLSMRPSVRPVTQHIC